MYIIERIISIAIFLLINFITAFVLMKSGDNYKHIKRVLIFYVFILCVISFFYVPSTTSDLTRLRIYIDNVYSNMTFRKYLEVLSSTPTFTTHTYYYIISKIGIKELLSVISCLINYSIMSYVLYDYAKTNKLNGKAMAKAILLYAFIGEYIEVVSGIRSMCAYSIYFLCIYREFFQKKEITSNLVLYLLSVGFHTSAVPLVFARFIFLLFQKENVIAKKIFNILVCIVLLYISIKYGNTIIEATTTKAENYLNNDIFSYFWTQLSTILMIVLILTTYFSNNKIIKESFHKNYINFFRIFVTFNIISIFLDYSIFRRYSRISIMLFLPIVMCIFNKDNLNNKKYFIKSKNIIYYIISIAILLIEASRGDLCGIRFFTF